MTTDERDDFMRAKALVGEDYVILSRVQLADLMRWAAEHAALAVVDPAAAFALWVADYVLTQR